MSKELYNFLYDLSSSHRVGTIVVNIYDESHDQYVKRFHDDKYINNIDPAWWSQISIKACSNLKQTELCSQKIKSLDEVLSSTYLMNNTLDEKGHKYHLVSTEPIYPEIKELLKEEK